MTWMCFGGGGFFRGAACIFRRQAQDGELVVKTCVRSSGVLDVEARSRIGGRLAFRRTPGHVRRVLADSYGPDRRHVRVYRQ